MLGNRRQKKEANKAQETGFRESYLEGSELHCRMGLGLLPRCRLSIGLRGIVINSEEIGTVKSVLALKNLPSWSIRET